MSALTPDQLNQIAQVVAQAVKVSAPPDPPNMMLIVLTSIVTGLFSSGVMIAVVTWFGRGAIKNWFRESLSVSLSKETLIATLLMTVNTQGQKIEAIENKLFFMLGEKVSELNTGVDINKNNIDHLSNRVTGVEQKL